MTLLSAPQAFFGLALGGWVLAAIIVLLTVTAWITVVQRFMFVHAATKVPAIDASRGESVPVAAPQALQRRVPS